MTPVPPNFKEKKKKIRCTKCGGMDIVEEKYYVDQETAYCAECAAVLKLGTSKEARSFDKGVPTSMETSEPEKESPEETL